MNDKNNVFAIDKVLVRTAFNNAASAYDDVAVLQREVGNRMLERLDLIRINPERILDVGAGTGRCSKKLAQRYKHAQIVALDIALSMLRTARRRTPPLKRWFGKHAWLCGDAENLPIGDDSMEMVYSNLTLQWCTDLDNTFSGFHRVLRKGGLLMFSSFGPDTLKELRYSWSQVDPYTHVNTFIDMHDIGDALIRTGFTDPVMDVEYVTLTYKDVMQLMRELKAIGAHNVTAGRQRGLTGAGRLNALVETYEQFRRDGVLPTTYEVIYGHAWVLESPQRPSGTRHASKIPLSSVRRHSDG